MPSKAPCCHSERSAKPLGSPLTSVLSPDGGEEGRHHGRSTNQVARIPVAVVRSRALRGSESGLACCIRELTDLLLLCSDRSEVSIALRSTGILDIMVLLRTWTGERQRCGQSMVNRLGRQALLSLLFSLAFVVIACGRTIPATSFTAAPVEGAAPLSVQFTDTSENTPTSWAWEFGEGATSTEQSPVHHYEIASTYDVTLVATNDAGSGTATTTRAITIGPGELVRIELSQQSVELQPGETHAFSVKAWDRFDNEITDTELSWGVTSGGSVHSSGAFTAGTVAGQFEEALSVTVVKGSVTRSASAQVAVTHGKLARLEMTAPSQALKIGEKASLPISAFDAYGNPIPTADVQWSVSDPASGVSAEGILTAGNRAGAFVVSASLAVAGETSVAEASFSVLPDPLDHVALEPAAPTVEVGQAQQLTAIALDRFENPISGLTYIFGSDDQAGQVDSQGRLAAGTRAGIYDRGVTVEVTQGSIARSATAKVTIVPGPLDHVMLEPTAVTLDIGATEPFTFSAFDEFGNEISSAIATWNVASEVGTIDGNGVVTAGRIAGAFPNAIRVDVVKGAGSASDAADVSIRPDPLATVDVQPNSVVSRKGGYAAIHRLGPRSIRE